MNDVVDETDRRLLTALQEDARRSFRELGRIVGLSTPSVAERVRRLEAEGFVTGYRALVDRRRVGEAIGAFLRLDVSDRDAHRVEALAGTLDAVIACHHLTGEESHLLQVSVRDLAALEEVIARFRRIGPVRSSVILSSPVDGKPVSP